MHLAIEIDGDSHFVNQDVLEYDKERQNYIEKLGIMFLRFTNKEVNQSNDEVIEIITQKVKELQKGTLPSPPFRKGRE